MAVINGTASDDPNLQGTNLSDEIFGDEGADLLIGASGNDTLYMGIDNDPDTVRAGDGDDLIYDLGEGDVIDGGEGFDTIFAQVLAGANLQNLIFGNFTLAGLSGVERLNILGASDAWIDLDNSVTRTDTLQFLVDATLQAHDIQFGVSGAVSTVLEYDYGTGDVSEVAGTINQNVQPVFNGTPFNPLEDVVLQSGLGTFQIYYDFRGNPYLSYIPSNEVLAGVGDNSTAEDDKLVDSVRITFEDTNGNEVDWTVHLTVNLDSTVILSDQGLGLNQGLRVPGDAANNYLVGGDGNDTLPGGDGDDTVEGGDGDDRLFAGAGDTGNDSTEGGNGNDILGGGAGEDTLKGDDGKDTLYGGSGADVLYGGASHDVGFAGADNDSLQGEDGDDTLGGGEGDDTLEGGDGANVLYGGRGDGADSITGGVHNDKIFGGGGSDTVSAGFGDDTIFGGTGDDSLSGWFGNDELWGGPGNDSMNGGVGADEFGFDLGPEDGTRVNTGNDTIEDFTVSGEEGDVLRIFNASQFSSTQDVLDQIFDVGGTAMLLLETGGTVVFDGLTRDDFVNAPEGWVTFGAG